MRLRTRLQVLNFDDALTSQPRLLDAFDPDVIDFRDWGPRIRLGCSFAQFRRFEEDLDVVLGNDDEPIVSLLGSGDFHHVTLSLLRRLREPFVLLMLDNHPDWMSGVPFLHCGSWLNHALRLPLLERVIHLGGSADFDDAFRFGDGKFVAPGRRSLFGGLWKRSPQQPDRPRERMSGERLEALLANLAPMLEGRAVYVTFDKDVLSADDATVNWDSGGMRLPDALEILRGVFESCRARFVGMDVVGDWSPVVTDGFFRWALHRLEHPRLTIDPVAASRLNEESNLSILQVVDRFSTTPELKRRRAAVPA